MDITRIGYTAYQNTAVRPEKASEKKESDTTGTTAENQAAVQNRDTFVQTGAEKPVTYSRKLTDAQVQQLKDEQAQRMERFIQMLQSMVVKQGQRSNLTLFGMDLYVTPEQSRQAAESIAEGGEYSVDAVAGRIMDMAKALGRRPIQDRYPPHCGAEGLPGCRCGTGRRTAVHLRSDL